MRVGSLCQAPSFRAQLAVTCVVTAVALSCLVAGSLALSGLGGMTPVTGGVLLAASGMLAAGLLLRQGFAGQPRPAIPKLDMDRVTRHQDPTLPLVERAKAFFPQGVPEAFLPLLENGFRLRVDRRPLVWCIGGEETPQFICCGEALTQRFLFTLDKTDSLHLEEVGKSTLETYLQEGYTNGVLLSEDCLLEETNGPPSGLPEPDGNSVVWTNGCIQTFKDAETAERAATEGLIGVVSVLQ